MISDERWWDDQRNPILLLSLFSFLYVPSFPLSPPVEGATTIRRPRCFRLKALPSLQSSRPLFFSIRIGSTLRNFVVVFLVIWNFFRNTTREKVRVTEILLFFLLSRARLWFFSFVPVSCPSEVFFSPDDESALSKSSVFSHDATSIRPNKEVNHGETCVLFSILFSSFSSSSSRRTRVRAVYSLTRAIWERDFFLCFSPSRDGLSFSRSRSVG